MEFRIDRLSHPPTLLLKRGGGSGCTKSVVAVVSTYTECKQRVDYLGILVLFCFL